MKLSTALVSMVLVGAVCIGGTAFYFQKHNANSNLASASNLNSTQAAKALIAKATGGRAVVLQTFMSGPFQGFILKGTEANSPEGILFTYIDPTTGPYLISGNLMNSQLKSLTEQAFDQYISPGKAKAAWDSIGAVSYVSMGSDSAPHKLYVVADPNCVFCHQFYTASKSYVDSGQLQIRWILGAFLKDSSKGRAAAILGAANPAAAFTQNEQGFNDAGEEGGITPASTISPAVTAQIKANMDFMIKNQFMQTPTLIYKNMGNTPMMYTGLPDADQLKVLVNSMGSSF